MNTETLEKTFGSGTIVKTTSTEMTQKSSHPNALKSEVSLDMVEHSSNGSLPESNNATTKDNDTESANSREENELLPKKSSSLEGSSETHRRWRAATFFTVALFVVVIGMVHHFSSSKENEITVTELVYFCRVQFLSH